MEFREVGTQKKPWPFLGQRRIVDNFYRARLFFKCVSEIIKHSHWRGRSPSLLLCYLVLSAFLSPLCLAPYRQPLSQWRSLGGEKRVPSLPLVRGFGLLDGQRLGYHALMVHLCSPLYLIAPLRLWFSQLQTIGGEHTSPSHRGECLLEGQRLGHLILLIHQYPPLGISPFRQSLSLLESLGG